MPDLPTGTVTFLFTDIEGSSRMWESAPDTVHAAIERYHVLAADICAAHDGCVFKSVGDGSCAAFAHATDAVAGAARLQQAILAEAWPTPQSLRVRMALHTGETDLEAGDYYGTALNRTARLLEITQPGQILLSQTTFDLVRDHLPGDIGLVDLGRHRLRDLIRPEQVYQITHPGLPAEFPALASLDTLPHNLPVQLTSFVGREGDIGRVRDLVGKGRLLTLTGPGGCGKTRLSLQVGADMLDRYPDGVWFADLAPITEAEGVAAAVAAALEVREESGRAVQDVLVDDLRRKELLLILDNCEHHIAACARLVQALLTRCPALTVLATSRESLGVPGETTWRVPSLSLPDGHSVPSVERLTQFESVRLFVERGRAAQPAFEVTGANAPAVAQICWRLDGIPLAIELAAARVRHLTVEQISERLDDRFHLLTGGSRTALPRQQTLRAALDWSWDLLPEAERTLLRRLAVFRGGWTLDAAEAICADAQLAGYEVMDLMSHLVDKSLINVEEALEGARYGRLEMIREYSQERLLASDEAEPLVERHARFFTELAERVAAAEHAPDFQRWLKRLDGEYDNVTVALQCTLERPALYPLGWRLAVAMGRYWTQRRLIHDGKHWLLLALELAEGAPEATRADVLYWAGEMVFFDAQFERARQMRDACLSLCQAIGDQVRIARALLRSASVAINHETLAKAGSILEEALAISRASESEIEAAQCLASLAAVASLSGDLSLASSRYEQALRLHHKLGNLRAEMWCLRGMCDVALKEGAYQRANELLGRARSILEGIGDDEGLAMVLLQLGAIARARGDYATAESQLQEARAPQVHMPAHIASRVFQSACREMGDLAAARGDYVEAAECHDRALVVLRQQRDRWTFAYALRARGWLELDREDSAAAKPYFEESLMLAEQTLHRWSLGYGQAELGFVLACEGQHQAGWRLLQQGLETFTQIGTYERAHVRTLMGRTLFQQGDFVAAREHFEGALAIYRDRGFRPMVANQLGYLCQVELRGAELPAALALGRESLQIRVDIGTPREAAEALDRLAMVATAAGQLAPAAKLYGAAEALRESLGTPLTPRQQAEYATALAPLFAAFDDVAEVAAAHAAGRGMTLEAAVAEAGELAIG